MEDNKTTLDLLNTPPATTKKPLAPLSSQGDVVVGGVQGNSEGPKASPITNVVGEGITRASDALSLAVEKEDGGRVREFQATQEELFSQSSPRGASSLPVSRNISAPLTRQVDSSDAFASLMPAVLTTEGGYVDHPDDEGGATNRGITQATLAASRGRPVTKQEVRDLSVEEATSIYKAEFWDSIGGDKLPAGLNESLFDFGINSGPSRAVKHLQRILGVKVDGGMGPETLAAIEKADVRSLISQLNDSRARFVRGLSNYGTFGRGWEARISRVRNSSLNAVPLPSVLRRS